MPSGCGIGGDAFWLTWDAATGGRRRSTAPGARGARADAGSLRATGLRRTSAAGPADDHGPGRGPFVGRCARRGRAAVARRDPRPRPSSWHGTGSRPGTASSRRSRRPRRSSRTRSDRGAGFCAVFRPHGRPWRPGEQRAPAGAGRDARDARPRRLRRLLRGRPGRAPGARAWTTAGALITRGRPRRAPVDCPANRSRSTTGASGSRPIHPTAPGSSRSSCCRSCSRFEPPGRDGVRAGRRRATRPGSTSASRPRSWPWPTATRP